MNESTTPTQPSAQAMAAAIPCDSREFPSLLEASFHLLWLLQRLSYYEPERDGMPADGARFREGIREARKLIALANYEPGGTRIIDRETRLPEVLAEAENLAWLEANGASLYFASQPDMGGYNWRISHPLIPSSKRVRGRSPAEAINAARAALAAADAVLEGKK